MAYKPQHIKFETVGYNQTKPMKQTILLLSILFLSCKSENKSHELRKENPTKQKSEKIKVLNFGTFHFGYTPDANKTEFDENTEEAQKEIRKMYTA